jgi:hypothetical protein
MPYHKGTAWRYSHGGPQEKRVKGWPHALPLLHGPSQKKPKKLPILLF